MTPNGTASTLFERTLSLIQNCPRHISFARIAAETGLAPSWVSAFARNAIPDPGVHKVQKLFDYLSIERPQISQRLPFGEVLNHIIDSKNASSCVYIVRNNEDVIYIGCSQQMRTRWLAHTKMKDFVRLNASTVEIIVFEDDKHKRKALALEADLIRRHSPALNIMHKAKCA